MTAPLPGLSRRDAAILQLLQRGLSVDRVTEQGIYLGTRTAPAWTRAEVERLAATTGQPPAPRRQVAHKTTPWAAPQPPGAPQPVVLAPRQVDVLDGLCEALDGPAICGRLGMTEWTMKTHIRRLFAAFGAKDRAQLVALAMSGKFDVHVRDFDREPPDAEEPTERDWMTVHRAIRAGKLRAAKIGGTYRLEPDDVDEWAGRA